MSDHARERRAASNELEMLADLGASLDWLAANPDVAEGRVAVMGFRMGGTLALNLAATRRDLATCCFYALPAGSQGPAFTAPAPLDIVDDLAGPLIGFWGRATPRWPWTRYSNSSRRSPHAAWSFTASRTRGWAKVSCLKNAPTTGPPMRPVTPG